MSRLYIDGAWFDAASGETRSIINPFDGSEIARVAEGDQADARAAIISARRAFDNGSWSQTTGAERLIYWWPWPTQSLQIEKNSPASRPRTPARPPRKVAGTWTCVRSITTLDWPEEAPEVLETPDPNGKSIAVREPVGVCGLILPWNYPLLQAS